MNVQTQTVERDTFETLARIRDELRLQMQLAKAEIRDEWEARLEPKWEELKGKMEAFEGASMESGKEVASAVKLLLEELGASYDRIRKAI